MKPSVTILSCFPLLLLFSTSAYAQRLPEEFTKKNSIYVEAGGLTPGYSLNYDRMVFQRNSLKVLARAGVSAFTVRNRTRQALSEFGDKRALDYGLISEVSVVMGKRNHHFETGLGYSYSNTVGYHKRKENGVLTDFYRIVFHGHHLVSHIGYRYQKPSGGLVLRAGLKPVLISKSVNNAKYLSNSYNFFDLSAGVSLGWSF
ncbi:hypothetical protein [Pontibacter beigongshangensis]|uniref:hypothetical protein n=1 Tax=Pontibacter beigongshangensis TaxID=2574733 RepID=UPI00164F7739|nr:hypothetical protein [Pontibacter beigongshangensis]